MLGILKDFEGSRKDFIYLFVSYNTGKVFIFLTLFFLFGTKIVQGMNYWDSTYYVSIAQYGYTSIQTQVFSPIYPFLIRILDFIMPSGKYWYIVSAILISNIFGELFVLYLYMKRGFKVALLVGLFPVFLLFSTIPYSDDIAMLFLAISMEGSDIVIIGFFSMAVATFLNLAYAIPSLMLRLRRWYAFFIPSLVGVVALILFWHFDGTPFAYFQIERKYWGVFFGTPLIQGGSIMSSYLHYGIPSIIYLIRNWVFLIIFFTGTYLLSKSDIPHRFFLTIYCLSIEVPLIFVVGVPEFSIPRLLLPAFPALFPYAGMVRERRNVFFYAIICTLVACIFAVWQMKSFFA